MTRDPLLATKFSIPQPRPTVIPRPRLTERVTEGLIRPLTLIVGPAGFGKTTLIAEWHAGPGRAFPLAWLSLDEDDNDPTRFLTYVVGALARLHSGIGARPLAVIQSLPPQPPKAVLTTLVDELSAIATPFGLVLDDYHAIHSPAVHGAVAFLLGHLPPQMRLIVTGRADPPLALARLRANNLLTELRADDLRFTADEVAAFLQVVLGQDLAAADVAALTGRTEGWIAGLQLAALSLRGRADAGNFISAFAGSHRYIVDYLTEEALQRLPESIQSFLLETSILDRMCGPLCSAVTEHPGSEAVLEDLERANMFTIRLDGAHRWYRYHQLFAEMLRHRLRQAFPDRVPTLHRRASTWYEDQGLGREAVRHALAGQDFDRAARLVEESANDPWVRGEVTTLRGWLEALPKALVGARPRLTLLYAWALLLGGHASAVEPLLSQLERRLEERREETVRARAIAASGAPVPSPADIRAWRGEIAAIRARMARLHDDLPRSIELCRLALQALPPEHLQLRGLVALNLGIAYRHRGNLPAAVAALTEAAGIAAPVATTTLAALGQLGDLEAEQGQLRQAIATYRRALDAAGGGGKPVPTAAWAAAGLGEVMRQRNQLDAAAHYAQDAVELAGRAGNSDAAAWAHMHAARVRAAEAKPEEESAALLEAAQVIRRTHVSPWTHAQVAAYQARRWIDQGNIPAALRWAELRGLDAKDEPTYRREKEYLALTRLLIADRRIDAALKLLERLLNLAETAGLTGTALETLVLRSLVLHAQGRIGPAMMALTQALSLAAPERYVRVFVDEGPRMTVLLRLADSRGVTSPYAKTLLAVYGDTAATGPPESRSLVDPLSKRELDILRLIAAGLSPQEIAETLVIALGTVRNHLKNIHGKLGVHNRVQAVERARTLHVL